jgi:hypothetical protein
VRRKKEFVRRWRGDSIGKVSVESWTVVDFLGTAGGSKTGVDHFILSLDQLSIFLGDKKRAGQLGWTSWLSPRKHQREDMNRVLLRPSQMGGE